MSSVQCSVLRRDYPRIEVWPHPVAGYLVRFFWSHDGLANSHSGYVPHLDQVRSMAISLLAQHTVYGAAPRRLCPCSARLRQRYDEAAP